MLHSFAAGAFRARTFAALFGIGTITAPAVVHRVGGSSKQRRRARRLRQDELIDLELLFETGNINVRAPAVHAAPHIRLRAARRREEEALLLH